MADGFLTRGDHRVYWVETGDPAGPTVLILPAGPGAGHSSAARDVIGDGFRIIQIDPRGCGRSTPAGSVIDNSTDALVEDIEALRVARGIDRWAIVGHIWGAALAIAYAQAYPDRCRALVVASVYLGDRHDRNWFFGGASAMLPAEWDELLSHLTEDERGRPLEAFTDRIFGDDPAQCATAAAALMKYDRAIVRYWPGTVPADDAVAPADIDFLRIFFHYLKNDFFIGDQALDRIDRIRHIPGAIVQGRFDVATGMGPAYRLSQAWPEAAFVTPLGGAGYTAEPMASAVRDALRRLLRKGSALAEER